MEQKTYQTSCKTDIGWVVITGTENEIWSVGFSDDTPETDGNLPACVKECRNQINEYFKGKRKTFTVGFQLKGTDFQRRVWNELAKIPYGGQVSYKDIAVGIGNEKACRAVGNANGKNPMAVIVPCHRVIANNGKLGGYGGGLWRKQWLLEHENKHGAGSVMHRRIKRCGDECMVRIETI